MKKIVIFGASGTFGTALTKFVLKNTDWLITGVSRNETLAFTWIEKFKESNRTNYIIGDIRNYETCLKATEGADYCIIASAIKHIDYAEKNPLECTRTNINGVINCINACKQNKVDRCVLLSTDKAANPTTIYGCSKLYCEMYAKSVSTDETKIIRTRYGNIFGSSGSVAFIFEKERLENKPLTITNPNMLRYFTSLDDAVKLVWTALMKGESGDLWVFDNKVCSIKELADIFSDNQTIIGDRCIEKNDEAILTTNELNHSEKVEGYFRVNDSIPYTGEFLEPKTCFNSERLTKEELIDLVQKWREDIKTL